MCVWCRAWRGLGCLNLAEHSSGCTCPQAQLAENRKLLADKEEELLQKNKDLKATEAEKKALEQYLVEIKPGCDFITSNLDLRNTNRANEQKAFRSESRVKTSPGRLSGGAHGALGCRSGATRNTCRREPVWKDQVSGNFGLIGVVRRVVAHCPRFVGLRCGGARKIGGRDIHKGIRRGQLAS